ncbi:hypothetical protein PROFUN_07733 [Planoprotostelium fungivorum]|uniref:BTB domain-containing protein n=1 Tax=Planoprotostelium fungivorum TaxID=1890364 RepID=A0A2P6N1H6_9EUKA|nr:hypothetical protein PROFUN_07733 [Planoprotostelium fungivorum]
MGVVELNIGGFKYTTTRSTLEGPLGQSSYFTALLSGRYNGTKDRKGAFFIDRDGQYFGPILEYLRTGQLNIPHHLSTLCVAREAKFFSVFIPELESFEPEQSQRREIFKDMSIDDAYLLRRKRFQAYEKISEVADDILKVVLRHFRQRADLGLRIESGAFVRSRSVSDSQLLQLVKTVDNNEMRNSQWTLYRESYVTDAKTRLEAVYTAGDTMVAVEWINFLSVEKNQHTICDYCTSNGALRMDHFSPDYWNMHDKKSSDPNAWTPTRKTKSYLHKNHSSA